MTQVPSRSGWSNLLSRADQGLEALYLAIPTPVPLPMLANLKHLQLQWAGPLADPQCSMLGALTSLETLSLGNWEGRNMHGLPFHPAGALDLRSAVGLRSLSLWHLRPDGLQMPPACQLSMAGSMSCYAGLESRICLHIRQLSIHVADHGQGTANPALAEIIRGCAGSLVCLKVAFGGDTVLSLEVIQAIDMCQNLRSLVLSANRMLLTIGHMPKLHSLSLSTESNLTFLCRSAEELGLALERMKLRYSTLGGASMLQLLQMLAVEVCNTQLCSSPATPGW